MFTKKLLLLNKTKEVTKTSLFSVISSNIERILKEKVWMIRCARVRKIIYKIMLLLFVGLVAGLGYLGYKIHQNVETVMTFEKQVEAEVKKNKIPEYKTLALAIIYTESKGKSGDIMQSSESVYGQQEVIETPEEKYRTWRQISRGSVSESKRSWL